MRVYTIGDRILSRDKSLIGTVRWIGLLTESQIKYLLENSKRLPYKGIADQLENDPESKDPENQFLDSCQIYLGIEWDNELKGENNGKIGNDKIFDPVYSIIRNKYKKLYSEPRQSKIKSCSFITSNDICNKNKSFIQAVYERYVYDDNEDENIEFVGRDQAVDYFSDLTNLRIISVNNQNISFCGSVDNVRLPRLVTLNLADNLFSNWTEIIKIYQLSPKLTTLDISGNLLSQVTLKPDNIEKFSTLKTLYLNRTFIQFDEFLKLCNYGLFPKLETIHLCDNYISSLFKKHVNIPKLKIINLSNNYIGDLHTVFNLIHNITSLSVLLLNHNKISTLYDVDLLDKYKVNHLQELYMEDNLIYDWDLIVYLGKKFNNLKSLRLNGNPILKDKGSNTGYRNIIISLFPNLITLDGTSISNNDRINSERYFISMSNSGNNSYTKVQSLDPQTLTRLEGIHGRRDKSTGDLFLKKDFVELTLVPDGELCDYSKGMVKRLFSNDAKVKDIKIVCSKLFNVQYSLIRLVYNDGKMPISLELYNDQDRIDQYGISTGYTIRVKHPIE